MFPTPSISGQSSRRVLLGSVPRRSLPPRFTPTETLHVVRLVFTASGLQKKERTDLYSQKFQEGKPALGICEFRSEMILFRLFISTRGLHLPHCHSQALLLQGQKGYQELGFILPDETVPLSQSFLFFATLHGLWNLTSPTRD